MRVFKQGQHDGPEIEVAEGQKVRGKQRGVEKIYLDRSLEMGAFVGLLGLFFGTRVSTDEWLLWIDPEPRVCLELDEPEVPRNNRRPFFEIRLVVASSR